MADCLPTRDDEMLIWSKKFRDRILADWQGLSITEADAQEYALLHEAFAQSLRATQERGRRTQVATREKNDRRRALARAARRLARVVRAAPQVSDVQLVELRLRRRPDKLKRRRRPSSAPLIRVVSVSGCTVTLAIRDQGSSRRGRPEGTIGAQILGHVGRQAPADGSAWMFMRHATRSTVKVRFSTSLEPGTKVWLCAYWLNARLRRGPASTPIFTIVQGGGVGGMEFRSVAMAA